MSDGTIYEGNPDAAIARALELAVEAHLAGTGPGGQNVNKVASAVQLRVNARALGLSYSIFQRLKALAGTRMTAKGEIVLTARNSRTQEANRDDARARMAELIRKAHEVPKKRKKSRLNRVGKVKRLKAKKARGEVKANRGKVQF